MDPKDPAYRGQAGYTPFLLAVYDPFVLGFMARVVWRSPVAPVVERYRQQVWAQTPRCRSRNRILPGEGRATS